MPSARSPARLLAGATEAVGPPFVPARHTGIS